MAVEEKSVDDADLSFGLPELLLGFKTQLYDLQDAIRKVKVPFYQRKIAIA
jgi:hypothetical protein